MKINFNTAYCIAKEELSFIKLKAMLDLQRKNGLTIKHTYESDVKCSEMITFLRNYMIVTTAQAYD